MQFRIEPTDSHGYRYYRVRAEPGTSCAMGQVIAGLRMNGRQLVINAKGKTIE
jgi:hypothetical protein